MNWERSPNGVVVSVAFAWLMLLARLCEHVDGRNGEDEMDDHGGGDSSQLSTLFDGCKAMYNFRSS
jgi:hypothetical protein